MKIIYNKIFLEHFTGSGHPENRKRLEAFEPLTEMSIESGEEYLEHIHTKLYIEQVKQACLESRMIDPDTPTSLNSFKAAIFAAGATIAASQSNDFALVRPPGHHAHSSYGSGFCLFNNIAIATQKLVKEGKRILILDIDGHLGDGTLELFYDTDKVLFWSLHQYPAFPGGGFVDEIGVGKGKGYSINVPLPAGSGDDIYMHAITNFMTVAEQFKPDIVAVSAGFDAHQYDPLLQLRLTLNTYYNVGHLLQSKFKNIFAVLEGGYNLEYLPKCVYNFIAGINNQPMAFLEKETISENDVVREYEKRTKSLINYLSPYWKLLEYNFPNKKQQQPSL